MKMHSRTILNKLYLKLFKMEENKFLPPKYSFACKDLAQCYNVNELSTTKSSLSKTSSNLTLVSVPGMKEAQINANSNNELHTIKEASSPRRKSGHALLPRSIRSNQNSKSSMSAIHHSSPVYKQSKKLVFLIQ